MVRLPSEARQPAAEESLVEAAQSDPQSTRRISPRLEPEFPTSVGRHRAHARLTRLRFGREFGSTTSVAEACYGPSPEPALQYQEV
jgi:hypothetical protein